MDNPYTTDMAVWFPGTLYSILVPFNLNGTPKVEGQLIKCGYGYKIHRECEVEVPDNGKLVSLVIRSH